MVRYEACYPIKTWRRVDLYETKSFMLGPTTYITLWSGATSQEPGIKASAYALVVVWQLAPVPVCRHSSFSYETEKRKT
jgi:hypothetical protein